MSYVTAFWVGGLICALCQILLEKTKLMPGRVIVQRGSTWGIQYLSAICRVCRGRGIRTAAWLWKSAMERSKRSRR